MDFVADALFDGRRFRALTVLDNFAKESLAIEVDRQLEGEDVVAVKERLRHQRRLPQRIRTDNGSEFISMAMDRRAYDTAWPWIIPVPGSRSTTHSSSPSIVASGVSASTRTGSCRWTTPAGRSKTGEWTTIISGRIPRSATSRRRSSRPDSHLNRRPNFPVLLGPDFGRRSEGRIFQFCSDLILGGGQVPPLQGGEPPKTGDASGGGAIRAISRPVRCRQAVRPRRHWPSVPSRFAVDSQAARRAPSAWMTGAKWVLPTSLMPQNPRICRRNCRVAGLR